MLNRHLIFDTQSLLNTQYSTDHPDEARPDDSDEDYNDSTASDREDTGPATSPRQGY